MERQRQKWRVGGREVQKNDVVNGTTTGADGESVNKGSCCIVPSLEWVCIYHLESYVWWRFSYMLCANNRVDRRRTGWSLYGEERKQRKGTT